MSAYPPITSSRPFSGFSVDDLEHAARFYGNVLGLDVSLEPAGLRIELGDGVYVFAYPKPDHQPASYTMLNLPVGDIDVAVQELVDRGVELERYDQLDQDERGIARGLATGQGPDIAWFTDPAGNVISVLQTE